MHATLIRANGNRHRDSPHLICSASAPESGLGPDKPSSIATSVRGLYQSHEGKGTHWHIHRCWIKTFYLVTYSMEKSFQIIQKVFTQINICMWVFPSQEGVFCVCGAPAGHCLPKDRMPYYLGCPDNTQVADNNHPLLPRNLAGSHVPRHPWSSCSSASLLRHPIGNVTPQKVNRRISSLGMPTNSCYRRGGTRRRRHSSNTICLLPFVTCQA